jgi:hypothetical protein
MKSFMKKGNIRQTFYSVRVSVVFVIMIVLILAGWRNGGFGSNAEAGETGTTSSVTSGVFIDSRVQGLNYRTPTHTGLTNKYGRFFCNPGEQVQFMIGDMMLGKVQTKGVITPMDFVKPARRSMGFKNPMLLNMGRFLQSLDADGNPENGIRINAAVREEVTGRMINFNQSIKDFQNDPDVTALFDTLNGLNIPHNGMMWGLIDMQDARQHMIDHMSKYMTNYMNNHGTMMGTSGTTNMMDGSMGGSTNNMMGGSITNTMDGSNTMMGGSTNNTMGGGMGGQMGM